MIREMEHGRKLLEPEGKQACTQHDQVFIANFIQLVKKVHTTLLHRYLRRKRRMCEPILSIRWIRVLNEELRLTQLVKKVLSLLAYWGGEGAAAAQSV
jgi:hypothetical protein